jgi:hypothetical protein
MWACLENIGPNVVEQMNERIFTPEALNSQGEVLDGCCGSLPMDEIPISQGILQERCDGVDIVFGHLSDIFEHKGEAFQHTVLYIQLLDSVFVHQGRNCCEWTAAFRDYCNGHSRAHSKLPLLNFQVIQKRYQHVLRSYCLRDIPKGIYSGSPDAFPVSLQHLQEVKTDSHPFLWGHFLSTFVSNFPNQIYTVFLDFLISVFENGGESRQKILDWRSHLAHSHFDHNGFECSQNAAQHLGELLSETLIQI